jgi:hypothetical protein
MAPATAPGAQLAGKGIAAEAEAGRGFGAAAVGDLQRGLQQGMVDRSRTCACSPSTPSAS